MHDRERFRLGVRNSLSCWRTRPARASRCLGSESAKDVTVKAARRFAELQRRAPIRAPRERKREINRYDIGQPWRLKRIACSARSLQQQTVQKQQLRLFCHGSVGHGYGSVMPRQFNFKFRIRPGFKLARPAGCSSRADCHHDVHVET
jgi:hypothetical protein